ncbi:MAG TPA: BON domain-containing protein [Acidobacteriaceae bacterium]|nr:BON domain-containing protein [Acidobacteriaceae bacterium]
MKTDFLTRRSIPLAILAGLLVMGAGCKSQPPAEQPPAAAQQAPPAQPAPPVARDDQQIGTDIQAKIAAESALNGQTIQVSVANGIATLNGKVDNDASRALAAADSASVDGVKTVVNNLVVAPSRAARTAPPPRPERKHKEVAESAPPPPPPPPAAAPAQEPVQVVAPPPPPPPPAPVAKTVTLPSGTTIPIRLTETLDSASTQPNSVFHGSLAGDLIADGMVVAKSGASVVGRVVTVKDATHFSGSSELAIELTRLDTVDHPVDVVTDQFSKQGAGRGKNTAVKTGGGAAVGAILGGLLGGGKGAAIGAVTGGGAGAGVNAITRGQQVQIPTETLVTFHLQSPITVTTSKAVGSSRNYSGDGQLQQRQ